MNLQSTSYCAKNILRETGCCVLSNNNEFQFTSICQQLTTTQYMSTTHYISQYMYSKNTSTHTTPGTQHRPKHEVDCACGPMQLAQLLVYRCRCIRICTYLPTYLHTSVNVHVYTYMHACINMYIHPYIIPQNQQTNNRTHKHTKRETDKHKGKPRYRTLRPPKQ